MVLLSPESANLAPSSASSTLLPTGTPGTATRSAGRRPGADGAGCDVWIAVKALAKYNQVACLMLFVWQNGTLCARL